MRIFSVNHVEYRHSSSYTGTGRCLMNSDKNSFRTQSLSFRERERQLKANAQCIAPVLIHFLLWEIQRLAEVGFRV